MVNRISLLVLPLVAAFALAGPPVAVPAASPAFSPVISGLLGPYYNRKDADDKAAALQAVGVKCSVVSASEGGPWYVQVADAGIRFGPTSELASASAADGSIAAALRPWSPPPTISRSGIILSTTLKRPMVTTCGQWRQAMTRS